MNRLRSLRSLRIGVTAPRLGFLAFALVASLVATGCQSCSGEKKPEPGPTAHSKYSGSGKPNNTVRQAAQPGSMAAALTEDGGIIGVNDHAGHGNRAAHDGQAPSAPADAGAGAK